MQKTVTEQINKAYDVANHTTGRDSRFDMQYTPLVPSINLSSAHAYADEDSLAKYHENKMEHHRYSRDSNPTVSQLEYLFSEVLESNAILFSSGMAAIWSILWSVIEEVDSLATIGSFYRKTQTSLDELSAVARKPYDSYPDVDSFLRTASDRKVLVHVESPSNPFLRIVDIREIRKRFPNAIIVYDNTLAGLLNDKTSDADADFVVSSCTKYVGGHNDVIGGVVLTPHVSRMKRLWEIRSSQGGILDSLSGYLMLRSLKTYDARMSTIVSSTAKAIDYLASHRRIVEYYYPGSGRNADQAELFSELYHNGAGVITFLVAEGVDLKGGLAKLHSTKMAPSFGSTDSLIERPATMSHAGKSSEELAHLGLSMNHVRLSVGMEPVEYILRDLDRLLGKST